MPKLKYLFIQGFMLALFMTLIFSGIYLIDTGNVIGYLILITGTLIFGFTVRKVANFN
ncbi:hypothetical protein O0Q50_18940 [Priestia aryabhattai]|uniref:Uncharacterized protein n=1 Tax=Priestia aryabhattai TaxID=412384 RepID=A0AAX6NCN6_PRIAR|nr:hypothetical protein [Priestia aryabhattai]MDU9693254.1 hypothetical protein [Priestia aryabhattai]